MEYERIRCSVCGLHEEGMEKKKKALKVGLNLPLKVGDKCELCSGMLVIWTQEMQEKADESYRDYKDNKSR